MDILPSPKRIDFSISIFPWSEVDALALWWFMQNVAKELKEEINKSWTWSGENIMFAKLEEVLQISYPKKEQIEELLEDWFYNV